MSPWKIALPFLTVYVTGMPRYKPVRIGCVCAEARLKKLRKEQATANPTHRKRRDFSNKADLRKNDRGKGRFECP
jgi:hypothetical protein